MKAISIILFDLGNVLVSIDFNSFWRSLGLCSSEQIAPYADGYKLYTHQYETGRLRTEEYLDHLHTVFQHKFTQTQLEEAFTSIMQEPVQGMDRLVRLISRTHHTALVSNTNELHYTYCLKKFDVLQILHRHYLSFQLHTMKPDQGFYFKIIQDQQKDSSEILFVDDISENIEAAKKTGMHAIQFSGVAQLEGSLKTLDVL